MHTEPYILVFNLNRRTYIWGPKVDNHPTAVVKVIGLNLLWLASFLGITKRITLL